jgi:RNA polymerase sigma-70 factor, ECF subfamily
MSVDSLPFVARGDMVPEGHLIARAQAGDESAFAALFERHKHHVYAICLRMTHIASDAEDLTQEVFLLLFRKLALFRGDSAFSTWLYRLTVNVALSHLRRQSVRCVVLEPEDAEGEFVHPELGGVDPRLSHCLDRVILEQAILRLAPSYRAAFALYELHGYAHKEIAEIMNWSVGNSKSQLHKARRKLRVLLSGRRGSASRPLAKLLPRAKRRHAARPPAPARYLDSYDVRLAVAAAAG